MPFFRDVVLPRCCWSLRLELLVQIDSCSRSEPNQKEKQNDRWIEHHINRHEQNAKTEIPARDANVTDNPVLKPIDDNNNNNNNSLIIRLFETNSKALMTLN
jgi:hypothetical protein